jgi:hypothetical protein
MTRAPKFSPRPKLTELERQDLTQEIEAPLDDSLEYRDEATLSRLDFEEIEIALDL